MRTFVRMSVVDDLAGISLLDLDNREVPLASLWRDRAVVLVFIRHFG